MIKQALELKNKLGFSGTYRITSYGLGTSESQLAEDQTFILKGTGWSIEYRDTGRFEIRSLKPFEGSYELKTHLHARNMPAPAPVADEGYWQLSLIGHPCSPSMRRREIKEKYACVRCDASIILLEPQGVVGYIHRNGANKDLWLSLQDYLCGSGASLPSTTIRSSDGSIRTAREIKKQYKCVLDDDAVYLVSDNKVVGKIYQGDFSLLFWTALRHYLTVDV